MGGDLFRKGSKVLIKEAPESSVIPLPCGDTVREKTDVCESGSGPSLDPKSARAAGLDLASSTVRTSVCCSWYFCYSHLNRLR